MQNYQDVFIGYVDILGYKTAEQSLDRLGARPSSKIFSNMWHFLQRRTEAYNDHYSEITWMRYGDGYFCHSHDEKIQHLSRMVKDSCNLIALTLNDTIPLRMAITQGHIKIDLPDSGATVTGPGWTHLDGLERKLAWMGDLLHLPSYDGKHHATIQDLIQTTHLVKQQHNARNGQHFKAPLKQGEELSPERTWFLNWHKCLHLPKPELDRQIRNWWQNYVRDPAVNESQATITKQENSIVFADYCRTLYHAANLIYFSGIAVSDKYIRIGEINSHS